MADPSIPAVAEVVETRREAEQIVTLRLRLRDAAGRRAYRFQPGQFNMVYSFGTGEVPISIVSDPTDSALLDHTVRAVGPVTEALARLNAGDAVGLRGPYGSCWPLEEARGRDLILVTGGLGCAPVVSVINYVVQHRADYGAVKILHGVKTPRDLLYRQRFLDWMGIPNTEVLLAASRSEGHWKGHVGVVTDLFGRIDIDREKSLAMMCGPEGMMLSAVEELRGRGVPAARIYLSLERNMKCAVGFCGRCQFGPAFICKDGPVFRYDRIKPWLAIREL